ncbi:hypothetical protein [Clostridium sp.]|uniref:hypothetical protein n=1 Tax=Clostridium sp. TaxID=1506 RepID=UPI002FCAA72C
MAQVIKYDNGGSTTKKYGTFTYDNITHQVDDDFINQLSSYGKSLESRVGNQFQNIIDAVKHGKDVTFTSSGDGSLSDNVSFDVTDSQQERLKTPRRALGRFFGNA